MRPEELLPDAPEFSRAEWERCRASGDYRAILFEWYKYVAAIANLVASIKPTSPAARPIPTRWHGALIGLLSRCSRLMLSNIALASTGRFGETTSLLDRCIFESAVKVLWLCSEDTEDAFARFFADGTRAELDLRSEIEAQIEGRGTAIAIEKRMLDSIHRTLAASGATPAGLEQTKRLPDLASMIAAIGKGKLMYVVGQRLGSHHVHGTWVSLQTHYLRQDKDGSYRPRGHDCDTHVNQLVWIPLCVVAALKAYCRYLMPGEEQEPAFLLLLRGIEQEIIGINRVVIGDDFDPVERGRSSGDGVAAAEASQTE